MDDLVLTEEDIQLLFRSKSLEDEGKGVGEEPKDMEIDQQKELPKPSPPPPRVYPVQTTAPHFPTTAQSQHPTPTSHPPPSAVPATPAPDVPVASLKAPAKPVIKVESPARERYHSKGRRLGRALLTFLAAFLISFSFINAGTFFSKVSYWWETDIRGKENAVLLPSPPEPNAQTTPLSSNRLIIPKIGVDAPILWGAPGNEILQALQKGVAHYQGTSLPNRQSGNVFITGHSSNYLWDKGQYNHVFANLDKLVAGDLIALTTQNTRYLYKVKDNLIVKPTQLEVLNPTPNPILSLMTCTPVGTNLRRLIIRSDLVDVRPLEKTNTEQPLNL